MANALTVTLPAGESFQLTTNNGGTLQVGVTQVDTTGSAAGPAPVAGVDDGAVTIAGSGGSAGLLTYLKGTLLNQVLRWTGAAWAASADVLSFNGRQGAVAPAAADYTTTLVTNASTVPGATNTDALNSLQATATAAQQPFRATFYVDPTFAGTQTGSSSNPFTTIAAAFAAGAALALIGGLVLLPPVTTIVENVVFPTTGNWEIACLESSRLATITGTVSCTTTTTGIRARLTNIQLSGAISGDVGTGQSSIFVIANCRINSTVSLTRTGTGTWDLMFVGRGTPGINSLGGFVTGAVSVAGNIQGVDYTLSGALTWSTIGTSFIGCRFATGSFTVNAAGATGGTFLDCVFAAATTITGVTSSVPITMDSESLASAMGVGLTLAGTASLKTLNSNLSYSATETGNRGSTAFGSLNPTGLYEVLFDATLLAAGTAGTYVVNAIYTDMTGTLVTAPVGGAGGQLLITAAVATKASGVLQFQHNGATAIAFSTTGVVTPGALSIALAVCLRRAN